MTLLSSCDLTYSPYRITRQDDKVTIRSSHSMLAVHAAEQETLEVRGVKFKNLAWPVYRSLPRWNSILFATQGRQWDSNSQDLHIFDLTSKQDTVIRNADSILLSEFGANKLDGGYLLESCDDRKAVFATLFGSATKDPDIQRFIIYREGRIEESKTPLRSGRKKG
jgi:hypothetical protein